MSIPEALEMRGQLSWSLLDPDVRRDFITERHIDIP